MRCRERGSEWADIARERGGEFGERAYERGSELAERHANAEANWLIMDGSKLVIGTDRAIDEAQLAG